MLTVCVLSSASLRRYTKIIVMIGYGCVAREKKCFYGFYFNDQSEFCEIYIWCQYGKCLSY